MSTKSHVGCAHALGPVSRRALVGAVGYVLAYASFVAAQPQSMRPEPSLELLEYLGEMSADGNAWIGPDDMAAIGDDETQTHVQPAQLETQSDPRRDGRSTPSDMVDTNAN